MVRAETAAGSLLLWRAAVEGVAGDGVEETEDGRGRLRRSFYRATGEKKKIRGRRRGGEEGLYLRTERGRGSYQGYGKKKRVKKKRGREEEEEDGGAAMVDRG